MTDLLEIEEEMAHIPVLLEEVVKYLSPRDEEIYVDATFGAGGYSKAILQAANCKVIAIDQDPSTAEYARELKQEFPDRFEFINGNFENINELLFELGIAGVDGVIMDLGVSSMQLDSGDRGFSFLHDGPLDMRMSKQGMTAKELVNSTETRNLAQIIHKYGEETSSKKIAKAIDNHRQTKQIETTEELANIVRKAIGYKKSKIDLATKTFQALRVYLNRELESLEKALQKLEIILNPYGRFVSVAFHSLEDKIIKDYLKSKSGKTGISRYMPEPKAIDKPTFKVLTGKPIKPSVQETVQNKRARSAKLRAALKLGG